MRIKTKLYGYSTEKRVENKVYKSSFSGLVKKFGGISVGSGAILIPLRNAKPILNILDSFKVKYNKIKLFREIT